MFNFPTRSYNRRLLKPVLPDCLNLCIANLSHEYSPCVKAEKPGCNLCSPPYATVKSNTATKPGPYKANTICVANALLKYIAKLLYKYIIHHLSDMSLIFVVTIANVLSYGAERSYPTTRKDTGCWEIWRPPV